MRTTCGLNKVPQVAHLDLVTRGITRWTNQFRDGRDRAIITSDRIPIDVRNIHSSA